MPFNSMLVAILEFYRTESVVKKNHSNTDARFRSRCASVATWQPSRRVRRRPKYAVGAESPLAWLPRNGAK